MTDDMPEIEVVYLGKVILKGGKEGMLLVTLEQAKTFGERARNRASPFDTKGSTMRVVGGIYRCQGVVGPDGIITTYRPSTTKFVGPFNEGGGAPMAWQAEHEAVKVTMRAKSREKSAETDTALRREIATLKRMYRNVSPAYRQAFKLWLLDELDKP